MKIILTDEYYIDADPLNYELVARRKNKNAGKSGKVVKNEYTQQTIGYYRTLQGAVDRFITCVAKDKTSDFDGSIVEYCEKVNKIMADTVQLVYEKACAVSDAI